MSMFQKQYCRAQWKSLTPSPAFQLATPLVINKNELLIIPDNRDYDPLYKYLIDKDKFIEWIDYPDVVEVHDPTATLNEDKTILLVSCKFYILEILLQSKRFTVTSHYFGVNGLYDHYPISTFFIDKQFHLFSKFISQCADYDWDGSYEKDSISHFVFDQTTKLLNRVNQFQFSSDVLSMHHLSSISDNGILILPKKSNQDICFYSIITKQCKSLSVKFAIGADTNIPICSVITNHEQFIIIIVEEVLISHILSIYVLNLNNWPNISVTKSNICCPVWISNIYDNKLNLKALIINDTHFEEIITFGYIRKITDDLNISFPAIYIIKLIQNWCNNYGFIHLFNSDKGHCSINVDHIVA